ncbi:MAG: hypothetical protein ACO3IB_06065, partial [Phycisphaerales bacterium]
MSENADERPVLRSGSVRLPAPLPAALALAAGVAACAWADEPRPQDGVPRRLLARIDFEENEQFPLEIPQGFFRVLTKDTGEPGLPPFGRIATERSTGR